MAASLGRGTNGLLKAIARYREEVLERLYALTEHRYAQIDLEALAELPLEEQHKALYAQGAMDALDLLRHLVEMETLEPGKVARA